MLTMKAMIRRRTVVLFPVAAALRVMMKSGIWRDGGSEPDATCMGMMDGNGYLKSLSELSGLKFFKKKKT